MLNVIKSQTGYNNKTTTILIRALVLGSLVNTAVKFSLALEFN